MWGKNLAKILLKTKKKSSVEPCQVGEKEESLKTFWKSVLNQSKYCLKKLDSRCSIDRKTGSINRTRQRLTEFFKKDFDWSKIKLNQSKFWKKQLFRKITWFLKTYLKTLNIRNKNAWVWDEMLFQNTSFKPNFSKILILNNLPFFFFFFCNKSILHKTQSIFQTWLVRP